MAETNSQWRLGAILVGLALLTFVPFLGQAFHVDDPNFLALARHAIPHPSELYRFAINWGGTEEYAFDILANPPLVPWYLALVSILASGREWVFHLAFVPFFFIALMGTYRLGCRFAPQGEALWTLLFAAVSPAFFLAAHTVMPDLPLLAFYVAGVALAIEGIDAQRGIKSACGGLVAGLASLCRYSGMTAIPLLILYLVLRKPRRGVIAATLTAAIAPLLAWSWLSYRWYGRVHYLTIAGFEGQTLTLESILHKLGYQVVALGLVVGLAGVIVVTSNRGGNVATRIGLVVGGLGGLLLGLGEGLPGASLVLLIIGSAGGGMIIGRALESLVFLTRGRLWRGRGGAGADHLFLAAWLVGMLVFNLWLLFASVRYLLPALVPTILLLQGVRPVRSRWAVIGAAMVAGMLSFGLSTADCRFAEGYRAYARSLPPSSSRRWFTGHWGLQYYLEAAGASALSSEAMGLVQPGDEIIMPAYAWPQELPEGVRVVQLERFAVESSRGLRTFSVKGRGCFYSDMLAPGPTPVWLPFALSDGPLEDITRVKVVP